MKNKRILRDAVVLTAFSLVMRISSIVFSMYLASAIGAQGVGLNQLTFSGFSFAVTVATAGISVAVTKIMTEEFGRGVHGSERVVMRCALSYAAVISLSAGAAVYCFAGFIGETLLSDARTIIPLKLLAPALPLMSVSSCFKGYLLAVRRASQIAISDFLEQAVEVGVLIFLLENYRTTDIATACRYISVSIVASEAASGLYLYAQYLRTRTYKRDASRSGSGSYMRRLLAVALPVAASSCLASALRTVENVSIPSGLIKSGLARDTALEYYGTVRGMALPILFLPYAFLASFTSLAMPEVSESMAANRPDQVRALITRVTRDCLILAIPAAAIYMLFADSIGTIVYGGGQICAVIFLLAPLVPLMYFDAVADGILKGMGEQNWVLKLNIMDSLLRIAMVFFLIPRTGFTGFMILMYISNIFNPVLSVRRMLRLSGIRLDIRNWIVLPGFASGAAVLCLRALRLYFPLAQNETLVMAVEIILFAVLYAAVLSVCYKNSAQQNAARRKRPKSAGSVF